MPSALPTDWWRYVEAGLADHQWSAAEFARRSDIDRSLIGRWRDQEVRPTPELARRVAAAFGDSTITAYVAAGILRRDEVDQPAELPADLSTVHTDVLFAELRRRVRDFGNSVDIPSDEEIAAHPERYSEGRISLDEPTGKRARRGAAGSSPAG